MRVNAINNVKFTKNQFTGNLKNDIEPATKPIPNDSVSFKGIKGAAKGGAVFALLGAAVGALVSGGALLVPTMIYFGACNSITGAIIGHEAEEYTPSNDD